MSNPFVIVGALSFIGIVVWVVVSVIRFNETEREYDRQMGLDSVTEWNRSMDSLGRVTQRGEDQSSTS